MARAIDTREQVLVVQNLAHFRVSGTALEATAALVAHLTKDDWLHLHYRDKALMLSRGVPVAEFFLQPAFSQRVVSDSSI